jgi:hypothetical protein
MHRKLFTTALVISLALSAALAQQTTTAPSVERLRAHIEYLASDKLQGRRTGSEGAKAAAEYIAHEFRRLGLRRSIGYDTPGMSILEADSPRSYLQFFPFVASVELGKRNSLQFKSAANATAVPPQKASSITLDLQKDWMPLGFSTAGGLENTSAVLVGYGLTVSELKYDDYAGADVSGKIAIAFSGTPAGDNPHSEFARFEHVRWKAIAARNAGAKALLIIAGESNFKDDPLSKFHYSSGDGDAGIPVIAVSRQAAARLLFANSSLLADVEQRLRNKAAHKDEDQSAAPPIQSVFITLSTDVIRREVQPANVIGILDGADPTLKNEVVVIGAHYDHLGLGGEGSLASHEGEIHHGADDNASGTAAMLELARIFTQPGSRPKRTLVFIAFSGEEEGLLGSNYYVNHPILPLANTVAMLNLDMVGRMKENKLIIGGVGSAQQWRAIVDAENRALGTSVSAVAGANQHPTGYPIVVAANGRPIVTSDTARQFALTLNEDGFGPSDHSSFYAKQIPVLFFWTGNHEDYHKPSDTADKINYADEVRVIELVARIVADLDSSTARPTYTVAKSESSGRATGFRVYLGTIPNYADSTDGLLLDGVRENSPAATAGIKAGDKIVKLAGREIRNVYDYTYALGEMKAGQEYEVELVRAGERIKLTITPGARK